MYCFPLNARRNSRENWTPAQNGRLDWVGDEDFTSLANLTPPHPTPALFAFASLAVSFACVNWQTEQSRPIFLLYRDWEWGWVGERCCWLQLFIDSIWSLPAPLAQYRLSHLIQYWSADLHHLTFSSYSSVAVLEVGVPVVGSGALMVVVEAA